MMMGDRPVVYATGTNFSDVCVVFSEVIFTDEIRVRIVN
jgi:hypothetical protein